ncbi:unnamed protein product [Trypanosoma congolense IL3000]|uniref:WGS project CAEQ00000000 data, annotated contig 1423 n=1 Tax=Trypanosoma congolense (strain IL3000) TaxID=1068625 RepID=F9W651_TRYCI|nr:unnamed protein product [Trypanosoma congolense IL3000]
MGMQRIVCVGSLLVAVLLSGGATGNAGNSNGVCRLNENAAGLLCTIAKLVEKAKNITENHDYKDIDETWGYVALHKEVVDHRVKNLPDIIETAKAKGTLTDKDAEHLTTLYLDAHNKNTQQHNKSKAAMDAHNKTHEDAKNSTALALGEGYVTGNCNMVSSLLGILQCYVKGEQPHSNLNVETICKEKNYNLDESQNTLLTNCNKIGNHKTYCNGTGAALKVALEKWNGMDKKKAAENGNCEVKKDWEERTKKAQEHMSRLDEHVQIIHDAKLLTTAYFAIVDKIKTGVENGKPMKVIVANAREAGQKGAKVVVGKLSIHTENDTHNTTKPLLEEEEVNVNVQLDGLKFDEDENGPAHSKESFPKIYIYLLSILLPLFCLVMGITLYCLIRKPRSSHPEKSTPVDGATMNKAGDTQAHF